jgi:hypothetical protein
MSAIQYGAPCEPSWEFFLGGRTPEPTHEGCPGGSNTPGLIGGWTCPCDCHRQMRPESDPTGKGR